MLKSIIALVKSRKFLLTVASLITLWLGPDVLEVKVTNSVLLLMGLAGLIAAEDVAAKLNKGKSI